MASSTCKCRSMFTILYVWLIFELNPHWSLLCLVCVYIDFATSQFAPSMCVAADAARICTVVAAVHSLLYTVFRNWEWSKSIIYEIFFLCIPWNVWRVRVCVRVCLYVCMNFRPVLRDGSICTAMWDAISSNATTIIQWRNGRWKSHFNEIRKIMHINEVLWTFTIESFECDVNDDDVCGDDNNNNNNGRTIFTRCWKQQRWADKHHRPFNRNDYYPASNGGSINRSRARIGSNRKWQHNARCGKQTLCKLLIRSHSFSRLFYTYARTFVSVSGSANACADFDPENWIRVNEWVSECFCLSAENQTRPNRNGMSKWRKHRHPFNLIVQLLLFCFSFFHLLFLVLLFVYYVNRIISQLIQTFMMIMATRSVAHKKHHRCAASQLIKTRRTLAAGIYSLTSLCFYYDACLIVACASSSFRFAPAILRALLSSLVSVFYFLPTRRIAWMHRLLSFLCCYTYRC